MKRQTSSLSGRKSTPRTKKPTNKKPTNKKGFVISAGVELPNSAGFKKAYFNGNSGFVPDINKAKVYETRKQASDVAEFIIYSLPKRVRYILVIEKK